MPKLYFVILFGVISLFFCNGVYANGGIKSGILAVAASKVSKSNRLHELMHDTKLGRAARGWIKQEVNAVKRSKYTKKRRKHIRNPIEFDLAHGIGKEAAKGYDYRHADLKPRALHQARHKIDHNGKKNKDFYGKKGK